jgi:hypothetical protein
MTAYPLGIASIVKSSIMDKCTEFLGCGKLTDYKLDDPVLCILWFARKSDAVKILIFSCSRSCRRWRSPETMNCAVASLAKPVLDYLKGLLVSLALLL